MTAELRRVIIEYSVERVIERFGEIDSPFLLFLRRVSGTSHENHIFANAAITADRELEIITRAD